MAVEARCRTRRDPVAAGTQRSPEPGHFAATLAEQDDALRYESARTRLAFGERLRRRHRVLDARPRLQRARELFGRLGATAWERRAAFRAAGRGRGGGHVPPRMGGAGRPDAPRGDGVKSGATKFPQGLVTLKSPGR
ncbi:hypothetical protein ACWDE9_17775 [Streptomyces olivaceoviridis]